MDIKISRILEKIAELEKDLEHALLGDNEEKQKEFKYRIEKEKILFEEEMRRLQGQMKKGVISFLLDTPLMSLLVAPVIYSLYLPLLLLDLWIYVYQAVCFWAYGISRVKRSDFVVLDRGKLPYLNAIEQFNCNYCGYANGLVAYAREVASKTELYFCPIKHARKVLGVHPRYWRYQEFGDGEGYRNEVDHLREEVKKSPPQA